jgi:hypothetical protein
VIDRSGEVCSSFKLTAHTTQCMEPCAAVYGNRGFLPRF